MGEGNDLEDGESVVPRVSGQLTEVISGDFNSLPTHCDFWQSWVVFLNVDSGDQHCHSFCFSRKIFDWILLYCNLYFFAEIWFMRWMSCLEPLCSDVFVLIFYFLVMGFVVMNQKEILIWNGVWRWEYWKCYSYCECMGKLLDLFLSNIKNNVYE